jgi:predicted transcriptional regulator
MIEHAYIKINQIYSSNKNFIDFKRSDKTIRITEEEFFALLFSNVLDLINPLYYLYLKNPYNLKALEHLATTYQHDTNKKSMNAINNMTKQVTDELMPNPEATLVEKQKEKENYQYFEDSGIQSLALKYINHAAITYESNYSKTYDISYDLNFIMCNQDFENIDIKLITNYLGDKEIVKQLILHSREYEKTSNQNIKIFMRLFKQNFCEDDNPELITDYFKSINVLEQRFLRLGNHDTNSSWDDSIVTDYIAYCKYIDEAWHRNNPNNIRPVPYNRNSYINALIIQYLSDSSPDNSVVNTIKEFYSKENKNDLNSIVNELTAKIINRKNKIKEYIELISQIVKKLLESNQQKEDHLILLSFMCHSYNEIIRYLNHENIKLCNNNMTELLEKNITDENYCDSFFNLLSNFNIAVIKHKRDEKIIGNYIEQTFNLINKIYGSNSIIVLNKLNESFNSIKSFLDKDTIKLCNQNMINLITLDHANKKSFLETLFMHLANLNDDITPESLPDDSFKHLLDNIQDIYNTDELKLNFIERFKNDSKNISRKIIAELKKN